MSLILSNPKRYEFKCEQDLIYDNTENSNQRQSSSHFYLTYISNTQQDMQQKFLLISLLLTALHADTYVYQDCVPCTSRSGCNQCLVYSGGPFNNQNNSIIGKCVDNLGGCQYRNFTNTVFSFSCGGCSVDGWCSYQIDGYFSGNISVWTGCSNSSDQNWNSAKNQLDSIYKALYGNVTHSWCDGVCDKVTPGQQALIIIASFGVVSVALALISHFSCNKISEISHQ